MGAPGSFVSYFLFYEKKYWFEKPKNPHDANMSKTTCDQTNKYK